MTDESTQNHTSAPTGRPRRHSWSRPARSRNTSIHVEDLTPNIVDGTAHICFSRDKTWFQGNIIEYGKGDISGSIYKMSGKIINSVEAFDDSENDIFQLTNAWHPIMEGENEEGVSVIDDQTQPLSNHLVSKISRSSTGESSANTPDSHIINSMGSVESGEDFLDSDLVKAAIERLNIGDAPASSNTTSRSSSMSVHSPATRSGYNSRSEVDSIDRMYNIALTEFETGMTYNMEGVYKQNTSSEITIIGKDKCNQISFKSKKMYKGNSADIIISRHLGPSFVDNNMSVLVGDIRLRYVDPVCKPSRSKETSTQWCN